MSTGCAGHAPDDDRFRIHDTRVRQRPRPRLPRLRRRTTTRPGLRLRGVLRPARGRLRLRVGHPRADRGRPEEHLALPPLLPVPADVATIPNIKPGFTKLVKADNLARELGVKTLCVKDDSGNPTHSFKDRVVAVPLEAARDLGFTTLSCSSTGNLADAVAAAAARAGFRSFVFIPHDLEQGKVVMTAVYGGKLVGSEGNYDDVNRFCSEIAGEERGLGLRQRQPAARTTPRAPRRSATRSASSSAGGCPDQVVIPIASGSQLTKIDKGFRSSIELGLVEDTPYKIFGAQAEGCSPVSAAFKAGHDVVRPQKPNTIAKSLAIGNPADGPYVLDIARRTGGAVEDVTDEQVVDGDQAARPHRGHLRGDRRRRDRRRHRGS